MLSAFARPGFEESGDPVRKEHFRKGALMNVGDMILVSIDDHVVEPP